MLEGVNGNVYYQFSNPSSMFQGYQNNGTPAAFNGNPFQIAPTTPLNCGPVVSCSTYLGGGVTRMSVRFTAYDGDAQNGNFDFNDLTLRINGLDIDNWSVIPTQVTNLSGTTLVSSGVGFGNNTFDTGWFQSTNPAVLASVLSKGSLTSTVFDRDPNDNYWDFRQGVDADQSQVPLTVAPGVTLDKTSPSDTAATVNEYTLGQTISYSYLYRNIGSVWVENIAVSDTKIPNVACPAAPPRLLPGDTKTCTATYVVTQADIDAGVITNVATAKGTPQAGSLGPVTDTVTISGPLAAPGVQLIKSATPSPFGAVGSAVTYAFQIKNTGTVTLANVSVSDPLLASLSCTTPAIAPGVTVTATCTGNTKTVTQADVDSATIANTATVSAKPPSGPNVTGQSTITTPGAARAPSIALVKTAGTIVDTNGNGRQDFGDTVNYAFKVTNTGNVTLTNVTVTDPLVTVSGGPIASLAPGAVNSTTFTAVYTLTQPNIDSGSVSNQATARGNPPTGPPVTDLSDSASNGGNAATVTPIAKTSSLTIDKTSPTASYLAIGNTLTYSYLVRNTGNTTLTSFVVVTDNKTSVGCPTTLLAPNQTLTCNGTYIVTQADIDAGSVTNTATAKSGAITSPPDSVTIPAVQTRAMTVVKSATSVNFTRVGDIVSYQYVITNTGNVTLNGPFTINDNRIAAANLFCPAGNIAPLATKTCTGTYSVTVEDLDIGSLTNLATATNGTTTTPQTSTTVPTGSNPALTIDKTTTATNFSAVNDVIPYSFLVTNSGNATFTRAINVTDSKIGTIACFRPNAANPTFTPAETVTCTANYTVIQADIDNNSVTNQASASTTFGVANVPVASPPKSVTINAVQTKQLTVTKSAATLPVSTVGQVLTYTITVKNSGNTTLSNINVTDPLIPSLSCTIASLAPNISNSTCIGAYRVTQDDLNAGVINNTATATGKTPQGTAVTGSGILATLVTQNSSVSIAKSQTTNADEDGTSSITLNDTLTYKLTVTNDGNTSQSNVVVTDAKLTPNSKTCATVAPGQTCVLTGTHVVTQAEVDAGTISNTGGVTTTQLPTSETATVNTPITRNSSVRIAKAQTSNADEDVSSSITLNDTLTYKVTVTNDGNVSQSNVVVSDVKLTPNSFTCPSVAPGQTCVLTGTHVVTQAEVDAGSIGNTGSVTTTQLPTPKTIAVTTPVARTSTMSIAKAQTTNADGDGSGSISLNDVLTYVVTVTNTGNVTQSNVVVTDAKLVPNSFTCPSVAPLDTCVLNGTHTVSQAEVNAGSIANTGSVTSALIPTPQTVSITTPIPQTRSLSIDKTSPTPNFTTVGNTISYSYAVKNTGNVTLAGPIQVTDNKTSVSCPALPPGGLAPNAIVTCSATYSVTQADIDAGSVTNIATTQTNGVSPITDTLTVNAVQTRSLAIDKTVSLTTPSFDAVGDIVQYNYVVRNTGNTTLTAAVTVADNKTTVSCPALPSGGLAPNATINCTASYTVTQLDLDAGSVVNIANATSGTTTSPSDTVSVPAVQTPKSVMSKIARLFPPASFATGFVVTYDYVIKNTGNVTLTGAVSVTDNRIPSVTCDPLPFGGLLPNATLNCLGTYTVTSNDVALGSVTNLATGKIGATTSPQTSETIPAGRNPALSLVKSSTSAPFTAVGNTLVYSYLITNSGSAAFATPITIVDDKIGTLTCYTPSVADPDFTPGETLTCSGTYTVTQADLDRGFVTNDATANVTYQTTTPVVSPPASKTINSTQTGQLTVTKSAATLPVTVAGQVLTYTIAVKNDSNVTVSGITVSDPLIPSLSCIIPALAPAASNNSCVGTYTVTQANIDAGVINNTATASGVNPQGAPIVGTGTISTPTPAAAPGVEVVKSATPTTVASVGEPVTYSFAVRNTGNVTLTNLIVTDPLIPALSCVIPSLAPGMSNTGCSGTYIVIQADIDAGSISNTATINAVAARGPNPVDTDTITIAGPAREPGFTVNKTTISTPTAAGQTLAYEFNVGNTGNVSISSVVVTDAKCTAAPTLASGDTNGNGILDVGEVHVYACTSIPVTQTEVDAGRVDNTASVAGTPPVGSPALLPATGTNSVEINQTSQIAIIKTIGAITDVNGNGRTDANDRVTYTFTVSNPGNTTLTDVRVTDPLVTVSGGPTTLIPAASDSTTFTALYTITQADVNAGSVSNTAEAAGQPPTGARIRDFSDPLVTTGNGPTILAIPQFRNLTIDKVLTGNADEDGSGFINLNDTLSYAVTVTNTGNTTLNKVVVSDPILTPASFACATLEPAATCVLSGIYKVTQADVNAGTLLNTASVTTAELPISQKKSVTTPVLTPVAEDQFTKTALKSEIYRGEQVGFVIEVSKVPLSPVRIVDIIPPGFAFAGGSASVNGVAFVPTLDGNRLTFDGLTPDALGTIRIQLSMIATAVVQTGPSVNRAELINPTSGVVIASAKASVTVVPEHVFDCGEIIGKVFDDKNRDGYQNDGEPGLPGVRLATVKGLLVTTDKYGRFHVACADIPDQDIGSNFLIKLDTRTLPTGYRITTENPRDVRLTRGKITKLNFGAAITRVVSLDLNNKVFASGGTELLAKWQAGIGALVQTLEKEVSTLRLTYHASGEGLALANKRISAVKALIAKEWRRRSGRYELPIETRVVTGNE